jgi:multicomponent K+:H+ antiporter subunit D
LVTLAVGAVGVLGASGLARMVAFAAIGSMGTLFIAVAQFTPVAMTAAFYYMIHSTLATAALFLIVDMVQDRRGNDTLRGSLPPMAQHGLLAALFFGGTIAMAGMPPLSGFLGKLLVLNATRGPDMALIWSSILVASLVTIVGFARAGSQVFWKAHATTTTLEQPPGKPEPLAFAALFALLAALAVMTVLAGPVTDWLADTTAELFDRTAYINAVLPVGGR